MKLAILLQYVLPHHFLTRIANFLVRIEYPPFKNFLIGNAVRKFKIDMNEAVVDNPFAYKSFNDFFTRRLRLNERNIDLTQDCVIAPADGKVSQMGRIYDDAIVQAKEHAFTLCELLGDQQAAEKYEKGWFLNIYLSPRDYHRIHMPMTGRLVETVYIPGRLFSVAPWAARAIPNLFSRNERLVCHFETRHGPMCVVLVGAMLVSGIETIWGGDEIPVFSSSILRKDYRGKEINLAQFSEIARFNFGSTVICFWPSDAVTLFDFELESKTAVGQKLGEVTLENSWCFYNTIINKFGGEVK